MVQICLWSKQPICFDCYLFFNVCIKSVKLSENVWTECTKIPAVERPGWQVSIAHIHGNKFKMTISDAGGKDPDNEFDFTMTGPLHDKVSEDVKLFQEHLNVTPVALSVFINYFTHQDGNHHHHIIRSNKIFDAN
jgi:hypothetical protein